MGAARIQESLRILHLEGTSCGTDVIREAIHEYIQRKASQDEFRTSLERAMQEHTQLIAGLAKY